jgi:hypothetical protein
VGIVEFIPQNDVATVTGFPPVFPAKPYLCGSKMTGIRIACPYSGQL